ncbi:DUF421 domain-containing protein [Enterococcus faecalis]|nr:DUF421 domain-containing protein [Enterococcus faecalis]
MELYADNKPNKQGFLKAKLSAGDFITLLRNQGITSIEDLNNVRIETNGQLSISEKTENSFDNNQVFMVLRTKKLYAVIYSILSCMEDIFLYESNIVKCW